jgi:hypothetical protein
MSNIMEPKPKPQSIGSGYVRRKRPPKQYVSFSITFQPSMIELVDEASATTSRAFYIRKAVWAQLKRDGYVKGGEKIQ